MEGGKPSAEQARAGTPRAAILKTAAVFLQYWGNQPKQYDPRISKQEKEKKEKKKKIRTRSKE